VIVIVFDVELDVGEIVTFRLLSVSPDGREPDLVTVGVPLMVRLVVPVETVC
jgi:hypothetical protein